MKQHLAQLVIALSATVVTISLLFLPAEAAGGAPVGVVVGCTCDDIVGARFCFALKEKIRASAGYDLVGEGSRLAAGMRIVCQDIEKGESAGRTSAVSITFTLTNKTSEEYLSSAVFVIGAHRVNDMAASALAVLDQLIDPFRERLMVQAAK